MQPLERMAAQGSGDRGGARPGHMWCISKGSAPCTKPRTRTSIHQCECSVVRCDPVRERRARDTRDTLLVGSVGSPQREKETYVPSGQISTERRFESCVCR